MLNRRVAKFPVIILGPPQTLKTAL